MFRIKSDTVSQANRERAAEGKRVYISLFFSVLSVYVCLCERERGR